MKKYVVQTTCSRRTPAFFWAGVVFLALGLWVGLGLVRPAQAAALLSAAPAAQVVPQGDSFIVNIRLDSGGDVVNAVSAQVSYPPAMLEATDVSTGGSFLTMWAQPPTVDAEHGVISFSGGIPHGSLVIDGQVLAITFRAKEVGTAVVKVESSSAGVYLNDAAGTLTPLQVQAGIYRVKFPSALSVTINSPTHPDPDQWYQAATATVTWEAETDAVYSYQLASDPLAEPDDRAEAPAGSVTFENLRDGIYYFSLKEKLPRENWSAVSRRKLMIDTAPPQMFNPKIGQSSAEFGGKYFLSFSTVDLASGVALYQVSEGGNEFVTADSPYVPAQQSRRAPIIVRAIDRAGNTAEATVAPATLFNWTAVVIITLAVLAGVVIWLIRLRPAQAGLRRIPLRRRSP